MRVLGEVMSANWQRRQLQAPVLHKTSKSKRGIFRTNFFRTLENSQQFAATEKKPIKKKMIGNLSDVFTCPCPTLFLGLVTVTKMATHIPSVCRTLVFRFGVCKADLISKLLRMSVLTCLGATWRMDTRCHLSVIKPGIHLRTKSCGHRSKTL